MKTIFPKIPLTASVGKRHIRFCGIILGCQQWRQQLKAFEKIADARVLDVISLGIDQDAQENFFHPEKQDPQRTGAGGVPVRTEQDYTNLFMPADGATTHFFEHIRGQMILSGLQRCMSTRSTMPGRLSPCSGLI